jgi:TonB family protein
MNERPLIENVKRNKEKIVIFIISLVIHLAILWVNVDMSRPSRVSKVQEKKIKVLLKKKVAKAKKNTKAKQVVNSEKSKIKLPTKEAKFLGKRDNTADRQVVAKKIATFKQAGKGVKTAQKAPPVKAKKKIAKSSKKKPKISKNALKKFNLSDLSAKKVDLEKMRKPLFAHKKASVLGTKSGNKKLKGLAQNNDFVDDIPLGDMTNLNTIEFKYFGFYHRVRQQLEQYWGSTLSEKANAIFKSGRKLKINDQKITSLTITIDTQGNIVQVFLKKSSGVKVLDEAAIESFNKAGPFPNPPQGMMRDGRAKIEWGFVVKG